MSKERLTSVDATRPGYGLRGRLLLSFIAISSFAAIAAIVGIYALYTTGKALHEVTDRSVPPAIVSLELAQRTERILAVGPTLLGVSSANELAGETSALDQEFEKAAQLVSELSNTGLSKTELTEIQTAFAQVAANFTALKAVTQKRIASADRKVKLVREIFDAYNQFRVIWTPRFEALQRRILLLRNMLNTAPPSTEERLWAVDLLNSALRDLMPLEQIQQEAAGSFEALLRAANNNTPASLKTTRDQVTQSVAHMDNILSGLDPDVSLELIGPLNQLRSNATGDAGIISARLIELETAEEGRRLTVHNSVFAARLSNAVEALVTGSKRGIAAATDQAESVQQFGSVTLLWVVVLSLATSVFIVWFYVGRSVVARLTALSAGMRAIVSGRRDITIPTGGYDEITEMGRAVEVFRDNAIALDRLLAEREQAAQQLEKVVGERTAELSVALEQQTATSEVLRIISSSPGELDPVFKAMLENATRLCEAESASLVLLEGSDLRMAARHNPPAELLEKTQRDTRFRPGPASDPGRSIRAKQVVQVPNIINDQAYLDRDAACVRVVEAGYRSQLSVPLIKHNEAIGEINILRRETGPFSEKQVELVTNFAAQAVIAIENTRLLNELRGSLQQQTATADMLKVLSRSTFDLQAVLKTLVESAGQLCGAYDSAIWRPDGSRLLLVAHHGPIRAETLPLIRGTVAGRTVLDGRALNIADLQTEDAEFPESGKNSRRWGFHSILCVPLMREGVAIGAIALRRREVQLFTDQQVGLLQTFADQAVIAIENARLFEEVKARTEELSESLQQQTATADVLKVISRSTFDLKSVLQTLVESAGRLCDADFAMISRQKDGVLCFAEAYGHSPEFIEYVRALPVEPGRGTATGRALLEGRVIHIADVLTEPDYTWAEAQRLGGFRTVLVVPMLRVGVPIGVLGLSRSEVRPFTEKQIELASTFADQAAIAIENVRLFDEIQDKSRQLAEASQHKSQFLANMSHELRTPLNAIIGVTEMLREDAQDLERPDEIEPLERVLRAARHLLALINDILDLSKIEAGRMELHLESFALKPLIDDVVNTIETLAAKNENRIVVNCDPAIETLHADQIRVRQA